MPINSKTISFVQRLRSMGTPGRNRNLKNQRNLQLEQMEDRRLLTTVDLPFLLSIQGSTVYGAEAGDSASLVSDAGDMNGDGYDDFVIGAGYADALDNLKTDAGESYVVFGGPSMPAAIDLNNLGSAGITIYGADADDRLICPNNSGSSAADVNGDGFDDLILQAWGGDGAGNLTPDVGEVYVVFGGASLPQTIDLANPGSAAITIYGASPDAGNFFVSGAGDVNSDGFEDVIIGGSFRLDSGESYIIYGAATLPPTIELANLGAAGVTIKHPRTSFLVFE